MLKKKRQIKVAFIGAGYMAVEHLKAFADIDNVELSGIASRTYSRAEKLAQDYSIKCVVNSISGLFEKTRADLVIIAVPELSVKDVCLEAFEFPWKCLIEKPAGYNVIDANEIIESATSNNRQAFLALNRRHYSSTREVLKQLERYQERRLVHVYDQENPKVAKESGQPAEVVDNWMYANSIHLIDYFSMLCRGELLSIENVTEYIPHEPCFVISKLSFSSGDLGVYEAVWEGPGPWGVTVTTQPRRWELRPLEQASFQDYKSREIESIPVHNWDAKFKPGLRQQAEEAIKAVSGDISHCLPTLSEGLNTMNIVRSIYDL